VEQRPLFHRDEGGGAGGDTRTSETTFPHPPNQRNTPLCTDGPTGSCAPHEQTRGDKADPVEVREPLPGRNFLYGRSSHGAAPTPFGPDALPGVLSGQRIRGPVTRQREASERREPGRREHNTRANGRQHQGDTEDAPIHFRGRLSARQ